MIPDKKGEPGYWTWPKKKAFLGGGAMWNTLAVDPQLDQVYIVTGNPIPYSGVIRGPGKELFTDSILALNVKTGKLRWYYQTTHHDIWDYDATNPMILFDLNGKKAIAHAGKTGWVYILNRTNGKPLYGIPEVQGAAVEERQHATRRSRSRSATRSRSNAPTKGAYAGKKAPDGKPYKVGCLYTPYDDKRFVAFAPSALGGANWPPSAYSPETGYMYICSKDSESAWRAVPAEDQKLQALGDFSQIEGLTPGEGVNVPSTGRLVAMNMRNNRLVWSVKWPTICYSGVTATAGNLDLHRHERGLSPGIQRADGPAPLAVAEAQGRRQRPRRDVQGERQAVRRRLRRRQRDRVALRRFQAELQLEVLRLRAPVVSHSGTTVPGRHRRPGHQSSVVTLRGGVVVKRIAVLRRRGRSGARGLGRSRPLAAKSASDGGGDRQRDGGRLQVQAVEDERPEGHGRHVQGHEQGQRPARLRHPDAQEGHRVPRRRGSRRRSRSRSSRRRVPLRLHGARVTSELGMAGTFIVK